MRSGRIDEVRRISPKSRIVDKGAQQCAPKRTATDSLHSEVAASSIGLRQTVFSTPQPSQAKRRILDRGARKCSPEGAATEMPEVTVAPESRTRRGGPDPPPRAEEPG